MYRVVFKRLMAGIFPRIAILVATLITMVACNRHEARHVANRTAVSKDAITALAARLQSPATPKACGAMLEGNGSAPKTEEMAQDPGICEELKNLGFVSTKADDIDIEVPAPCDENMGKVLLSCFKQCLDLTAAFRDPDTSIEEFRGEADFCAGSCEIGCDGKTDTERE